MIWLLTGPSCAGKTTLAYSGHCTDVIGAPAGSAVVFPAKFDPADITVAGNSIYHYNILRRINQAWPRKSSLSLDDYADFQGDPPWLRLLRSSCAKQAVVLVATRSVLLSRMAVRRVVEPSRNFVGVHYQQEHWQTLLRGVDLNLLYREWCRELTANGIGFRLVDSSDYRYRPMSLDELLDRDMNVNEEVLV
jgi:hypothetical protein